MKSGDPGARPLGLRELGSRRGWSESPGSGEIEGLLGRVGIPRRERDGPGCPFGGETGSRDLSGEKQKVLGVPGREQGPGVGVRMTVGKVPVRGDQRRIWGWRWEREERAWYPGSGRTVNRRDAGREGNDLLLYWGWGQHESQGPLPSHIFPVSYQSPPGTGQGTGPGTTW